MHKRYFEASVFMVERQYVRRQKRIVAAMLKALHVIYGDSPFHNIT